jgi:hypothetical protein
MNQPWGEFIKKAVAKALEFVTLNLCQNPGEWSINHSQILKQVQGDIQLTFATASLK